MKKALIILYILVGVGIVGVLMWRLGCLDRFINKEPEPVTVNSADLVADEINTDFMSENYNNYIEASKDRFKNSEKMYEDIVDIINSYRYEEKADGLILDNDLTQLAQIRAEEIAESKKMSHTRPDGSYFSSLFQEFGLTEGQVGENIAWGYTTAEEVCEQWKNSPDHFENLTDKKWTKTGIGIAEYENGTYVFVQEFATDVTGSGATQKQ